MALEWSNSLSTGIKWQDQQHRELFNRINNLLDAMNVGMGKEELTKLFKFLDEYFIVHFEAEEQAMHKSDFPHTLEHIAEHTRFIDQMGKLKEEARTEGVSIKLVIQTQREMVDWLVNHIGGEDKALAEHLKSIRKE